MARADAAAAGYQMWTVNRRVRSVVTGHPSPPSFGSSYRIGSRSSIFLNPTAYRPGTRAPNSGDAEGVRWAATEVVRMATAVAPSRQAVTASWWTDLTTAPVREIESSGRRNRTN